MAQQHLPFWDKIPMESLTHNVNETKLQDNEFM